MAPCSEQFLKVSWNSVQRSKRSSGLEIGRDGRTDGRTNERTDIRITIYLPNFLCGGYNNSISDICHFTTKMKAITLVENFCHNVMPYFICELFLFRFIFYIEYRSNCGLKWIGHADDSCRCHDVSENKKVEREG